MKRSPMPRISIRRNSERLQYQQDRIEFLMRYSICQIRSRVCRGRALVIHHKAGRVGPRYLDTRTWAAACPQCNDFLESAEGKAWGYANGFMLDRTVPIEKLPLSPLPPSVQSGSVVSR